MKTTIAMKTLGKLGVFALMAVAISSCKDNKKEHNMEDSHHSEMQTTTKEGGAIESSGKMSNTNGDTSSVASMIITHYLELKNALVAEDNDSAKKGGAALLVAFNDFDLSSYTVDQQKELKDILVDAKEQAEHISESPIHHQREHFEVLSKDILDLITITGVHTTLYKDFCPMYNDNKGGMWLSELKEIKNPYYGSKMLNCGTMQQKI